jgi:hypothetical protein
VPRVRIVQEMSGPYKGDAPWPRPGEVIEVSESEAAALTSRDPHQSHPIAELVAEPRPGGRRYPRPEPAAQAPEPVKQPEAVKEPDPEPVKKSEPEPVKPEPAKRPEPAKPVQARAAARGDGGTAHN